MRSNQYGGVKGLSTDHLLVNMWQKILENAEDYRAATIVTSIAYSKAFNRMCYQECLKALARNSASTPILELVATFLTDRKMLVRVGTIMSGPRSVNGGSPQGSILGFFLFNATIDDLEEGCPELKDTRLSRRPNVQAVPSTPRSSCALPPGSPGESPIVALGKKRKQTRLNCTKEMHQEVPFEQNDRTEARWKAALADFLRFIDDGFSLSKINYENSIGFQACGVKYRIKHAIQSQNVFRHVVRRAEDIGMVVNSRKTSMLCVSGALDYKADAYLLDADQNRIECTRPWECVSRTGSIWRTISSTLSSR